MYKKFIIVITVLFISSLVSYSQEDEDFEPKARFGNWTSVAIEKDLHKWEISAEVEVRTLFFEPIDPEIIVEYPEFAEYEPGPLVERVSLGLGVDYKLIKGVKLGLGYQFMSNLDTKYVKYLMRNRFTTSVTGKFDVDRFEFSLRERLQLTVKDDSKRLKSDGTIDTYKVNPELKWRNRFQVAYNIPKFKFDPTFSVESFFDLNNPDGNVFTKIRYKLAFDYKIQKHHVIDVFGVFNSVIVPDPEDDDYYGRYVLGVSYKYSF